MTEQAVRVFRHRYVDSVKLLRVSEQLQGLAGVRSAAAIMGTPMNIGLLTEEGFDGIDASVDDLVVAVAADDAAAAREAVDALDALLATPASAGHSPRPLRSSEAAAILCPDANIVVIAVPGEYAALEAWAAIRGGRDVFIFSDNVPLEDEAKLKRVAAREGLLVMGPDCGTSIIGGIGLGFANRVRRGGIGLVGASGTGIQQVSSLIHQGGSGIAAAIGTGSRDLSGEVGGIMTIEAISRLARDPAVERIGLVSKPADPDVAERVLNRLAGCGKPSVACLLGYEAAGGGVELVATLATVAERLLGPGSKPAETAASAVAAPRPSAAGAGKLTALYCGGTLCEEARRIAGRAGHEADDFIDLGDDRYTRGRAHPMIDPRLRGSMMADAGDSSDVILFDVVLGDLAHADPAGAILPALQEARVRARDRGITLQLFASLIGTDLDPQGLRAQRVKLEGVGVKVFDSNAEAARVAVAAALRSGR